MAKKAKSEIQELAIMLKSAVGTENNALKDQVKRLKKSLTDLKKKSTKEDNAWKANANRQKEQLIFLKAENKRLAAIARNIDTQQKEVDDDINARLQWIRTASNRVLATLKTLEELKNKKVGSLTQLPYRYGAMNSEAIAIRKLKQDASGMKIKRKKKVVPKTRRRVKKKAKKRNVLRRNW